MLLGAGVGWFGTVLLVAFGVLLALGLLTSLTAQLSGVRRIVE